MNRYLDMVDNPSHVKKLTPEQLGQLTAEIRHELITKLAKNGGHLGPNLGVVELTSPCTGFSRPLGTGLFGT